jgi:DNA repair protein RadA/Sms
MDCYLNIVGGLRADEPASDLAVAVALISSLKDAVIDSETIVFGEIGLAGEIRMVNNCEQRIKESERLGFKRCIVPANTRDEIRAPKGLQLIRVKNISEAIAAVLAREK